MSNTNLDSAFRSTFILEGNQDLKKLHNVSELSLRNSNRRFLRFRSRLKTLSRDIQHVTSDTSGLNFILPSSIEPSVSGKTLIRKPLRQATMSIPVLRMKKAFTNRIKLSRNEPTDNAYK